LQIIFGELSLYRVREMISQPANRGLVDLLLASPAQFQIPTRETDDSEAPALCGDAKRG
jgi:hypothetical protein